MSSQSRINASRANGAKSHGPTTPEGKKRSSQNATTHGLFAQCILIDGEPLEAFEELMQHHMERFQPVDKIELGVVQQMCAAQWRIYRLWTMETHALNQQIALLTPGRANLNQAFEAVAASPSTSLLHRYETRLQLIHQRAIRTLKLLRTIETKNEPSPIPEHPAPPPQPPDSETVGEPSPSPPKSSPPVPRSPNAPTSPAPKASVQPPDGPAAPPHPPKEPGGAV